MSSYGDLNLPVGVAPVVGSSAPSAPSFGAMWLNATTGALSVWDGGAWVVIGAAPLPVATAADQVLLSNGAGTSWRASSSINLGNF